MDAISRHLLSRHVQYRGQAYPIQGATPYLYGLLPGYNGGPTRQHAPGADRYDHGGIYRHSFLSELLCPDGDGIGSCDLRAGRDHSGDCLAATGLPAEQRHGAAGVAPQDLNDAVVGLTPGDLVLMTFNSVPVVAEVTGAVTNTATNTFTVPFANLDALHMNQTPSGGGLNSIPLNATAAATAAPCGRTGPCRIFVITYYIDSTVTPPRLMRQVNGHTPMPVADSTGVYEVQLRLIQ